MIGSKQNLQSWFNPGQAMARKKGAQPKVSVERVQPGSGIVLVYGGSFCPVHRGHTQVLNVAKERLGALGQQVVAGYFVPSTGALKKMAKSGKSSEALSEQRLLLTLALEECPWAMVCDMQISVGVSWIQVLAVVCKASF